MSSMRLVQVGGKWEPPPAATGLDPDSCASLDEWRDVLCRLAEAAPADRSAPTLQQVAVRGFRGVSPQLLHDLAQAAGVAPDAAPAELAPEQWQALYGQWKAWLQRLASSNFAATSCPQSGTYSMLGGGGQQAHQAMEQVLPFLHSYYMAPQEAEQFGGLKQQLSKAVALAIARLQVGGGACILLLLSGRRPSMAQHTGLWRLPLVVAHTLPDCLLAVMWCRRRSSRCSGRAVRVTGTSRPRSRPIWSWPMFIGQWVVGVGGWMGVRGGLHAEQTPLGPPLALCTLLALLTPAVPVIP
jgi:hypothetical protein